MKRLLVGVASVPLVMTLLAPNTFASSIHQSSTATYPVQLTFGTYSVKVSALEKTASTSPREYVSESYISKGLAGLGYSLVWDKAHNTLSLSTPTGVTVSSTSLSSGGGSGVLKINNQTIGHIPFLVVPNPTSGESSTYLCIKNMDEIFDHVGLRGQYVGQTWKVEKSDLQIAGNASLNSGESASFSLESPSGVVNSAKVKWSVTGDGQAYISHTGVFIPSAPGTYDVTATYQGIQTTIPVVVYGNVTQIQIAADAPSVVANGVSQTSLAVRVVDKLGHLVRNFNGSATLYYTPATTYGTTLLNPDGSSFGNPTSLVDGLTLQFQNGTATVKLQATTQAGVTDTFTVGALLSSDGKSLGETPDGTSKIPTVAQVATAIHVAPGTTALSSADDTVLDPVGVEVVDQTGNPMVDGKSYPLTFHVSGDGMWSNGSTDDVTSHYVGNPIPQAAVVSIKPSKDATGDVIVTVSATGLPSTNTTIHATSAGTPSKLELLTTENAVNEFGADTSPQTFTLAAVDPNGDLVPLPQVESGHSYTVYVTNSDGDAATNLTVNGTPVTANGVLVNNTASSLSFTVGSLSGKQNLGTYNVYVKDNDESNPLGSSQTVKIEGEAGKAVGITLTPASKFIFGANPSTAFSAQVVDANGNPVKQAGIPITFQAYNMDSLEGNLDGGTSSTTPAKTVATNDFGVATVTLQSEAVSKSGLTWTMMATPSSDSGLNQSPVLTSTSISNTFTTRLLLTDNDATSTTSQTSDIVVPGGTPLNLSLSELNLYGAHIPTNAENDVVSVTFGPRNAVALTTLPGNVTESKTPTGIRATGTVAALNQWLGSGGVTTQATGPLTVTAADETVQSALSSTLNLTVDSGSAATLKAVLPNGAPVTTVSAAEATQPITIEVTNAAGGVVPAPTAITLSVRDVEKLLGMDTTSANLAISQMTPGGGSGASTVTIPIGSSSVSVQLSVTSVSGNQVLQSSSMPIANVVPTRAFLTGVTANPTYGTGAATLSWIAPAPDGHGVTQTYNIYMSVQGGAYKLVGTSDSNSFTFSNSAYSGKTVTFKVQTVDPLGNTSALSLASNTVTLR